MADGIDAILAAVHSARETGRPLCIRGGDSKRSLLGRDCGAAELDVSGHCGVLDYHPAELYVTARAGTALVDIDAALAEHNQQLSFEPPRFGGEATIGGTLACNLSGPGRPWYGAIRDMAMGIQLVNGLGQRLNFGGKVVKNVAGYDVTRLQAGAMGTLGILTEVTVKVLPRPEHQLTLVFELGAEEAVQTMNRRAGEPRPLTGACWHDGRLYLRLSGAGSAVNRTARRWGGEHRPGDDDIWQQLGEMSLPFFRGSDPLWRFSLNSAAAVPQGLGPLVIDWCGAQRWLRGNHDPAVLQEIAAGAGGHVSLFRGGDRRGEVRPPLGAMQQRLQKRLKQAFDPHGLLNPGRLYSWM